MKILIIGSKGFIGTHVHHSKIDATSADFDSVFASQTFDVCINCSGVASVVTRDVEAWTVVGGNPASIIKRLK